MTKYLMLKHYQGGRPCLNDVPMDQWAPGEFDRHVQYMRDLADRLTASGEFVSADALAPDGEWVRWDGDGKPPVTDGPFAETKDLIAGWMMIDVDSLERAREIAAELSAAPGAGGKPLGEWLELRPLMDAPPTVTE
ncbi:YciI family protein [Cumulibacter manganitolerans]|uniref:YciI family protein n=1 Tax=Cumulibacter manganitolerans TaxID=1884992 RepID=UPI001295E0AD|nr:YciI family protein [Cumulibacter manganitolerans]